MEEAGAVRRRARPAEPAVSPSKRGQLENFPEVEPALEEEPDQGEAIPLSFAQEWEAVLRGGIKVSQLGTVLLDLVTKLGTPLGRFGQTLEQHTVAQSRPAACSEVLPISVRAILECRDWDTSTRDWMAFICLVLNYQYCSGFASKKYMIHSDVLGEKQKWLLERHLKPAVERMVGADPVLPSPEEIKRDLDRKGHDYEGGSYVVMEDLEVEKVIECWPTSEQAAVAPLEDFLEGVTKLQISTPMSSILPKEEWPAEIPKSYVRASDEVWNALVAEGYRRGLFQACPDDEVLKGPDGRLILNGAGAVPKMKRREAAPEIHFNLLPAECGESEDQRR